MGSLSSAGQGLESSGLAEKIHGGHLTAGGQAGTRQSLALSSAFCDRRIESVGGSPTLMQSFYERQKDLPDNHYLALFQNSSEGLALAFHLRHREGIRTLYETPGRWCESIACDSSCSLRNTSTSTCAGFKGFKNGFVCGNLKPRAQIPLKRGCSR